MQEFVLGEAIRQRRSDLCLTQEALCDGICEPETISRIEHGRLEPSQKVIDKILFRLGMPLEGTRFSVFPDNARIREIRNYLQEFFHDCGIDPDAISVENRHKILTLCAELHDLLDPKDVMSRQFLTFTETFAGFAEATPGQQKQLVENLIVAIQWTYPDFGVSKSIRRHAMFSVEELYLISLLGFLLDSMGERENALAISRRAYLHVKEHMTSLICPDRYLPLAALSYAFILFKENEYNAAIDIAKEGEDVCQQFGFCWCLPILLELSAECSRQMGNAEESAHKYRLAYYFYKAAGNGYGMERVAKKIDPCRSLQGP